jgi:predicted HicB family RNase H-like nuclease
MKPMTYKKYVAKVQYDDEYGIFFGKVINIKDIIEFKGKSVEELKKEFKDSVDSYIEFCEELGDEPEKPFSGNFYIRANPELHRSLVTQAQLQDTSFNQYVVEILEKHTSATTPNVYIENIHLPGYHIDLFGQTTNLKSKKEHLIKAVNYQTSFERLQ